MHGELSNYSIDQLQEIIKAFKFRDLIKKREVGEYAYVIEITEDGKQILNGAELPEIAIPDSQING